ncbi:MAG: AAA family ATPase [Deltaproteobacteria bacterium]|nr:AAA family ATPase [Kofleriaceae bacterium]
MEEVFPGSVSRTYSYPFLRVTIHSEKFSAVDVEDREEVLCTLLDVDISDLRAIVQRVFLRIDLLAPDEQGLGAPVTSAGWIGLLDSIRHPSRAEHATPEASGRFIHFYGFKGGQGRSTALAVFARALARDGWKVLAVDFDAEAPSLDVVFNCSASHLSNSVLGLRAGDEFRPLALGRGVRGGEVSVLPFRPRGPAYDIDAAALAFEFQVHAPTAVALAQKLSTASAGFDVVLVDHRTGMGAVVPTLVERLPGPVVVCARLDRQSEHSASMTSALWATRPESPGILLSLAPPEMDDESFREQTMAEASTLLQSLASANGVGQDGEPREWSEFLDHWIVWPFDRSVAIRGLLPHKGSDEVFSPHCVGDMRRLLGVEGSKTVLQKQSGARDEGDLIVTQALRVLRSPDTPIMLVVGRKGTGKTRLVRQLAEEHLGEPILVPSDFLPELGGLRAGDLGLRGLIRDHKGREEDFWYAVLVGAMQSPSTTDPLLLERIKAAASAGNLIDSLRMTVRASESPRTFLIDALESAFDAEQTFPFVQSLFRVLESIEATPEVSSRLQLKLFVRRDLVERGIQNREQLEDGRRLDLVWDFQTILNFVLTRIGAIEWYNQVAPRLVTAIGNQLGELKEGQASTAICEEMLLEIFPASIQYKNIKTATFLRTYFSDEGREASFYPRVYLVFLQELAKLHKNTRLRAGHLDGTIIVRAHEAASDAFLQEVSQELAHAVGKPQHEISAVLDGLVGKTTPFVPDTLAKTIGNSKKMSSTEVRRIFDVMKQLGIFEDHPKRLNTWRAGRLFKTGLRMRFATSS